MAVFVAWIGVADIAAVVSAPGPWREIVEAGTGLLLVESDDTLSRVYHEIKWLLPDDCPLLVAPADRRPKARGLTPGAIAWLRERID